MPLVFYIKPLRWSPPAGGGLHSPAGSLQSRPLGRRVVHCGRTTVPFRFLVVCVTGGWVCDLLTLRKPSSSQAHGGRHQGPLLSAVVCEAAEVRHRRPRPRHRVRAPLHRQGAQRAEVQQAVPERGRWGHTHTHTGLLFHMSACVRSPTQEAGSHTEDPCHHSVTTEMWSSSNKRPGENTGGLSLNPVFVLWRVRRKFPPLTLDCILLINPCDF